MSPDTPDDDRAAWIRAAVDRYERPLTIYAARLLRDDDRARDVVQDAFLRLWQADRPVVEGHLAKWLYTVCRNRALDVRRKEQRMTTLDDNQALAAERGGTGSRGGAAPPHMLDLVAALPDRQQEAVRLKFQGDLSYREIAEVMNTTVNNVGVMLHTAIKTIRGRLDDAAAATAPVAATGRPTPRLGATKD